MSITRPGGDAAPNRSLLENAVIVANRANLLLAAVRRLPSAKPARRRRVSRTGITGGGAWLPGGVPGVVSRTTRENRTSGKPRIVAVVWRKHAPTMSVLIARSIPRADCVLSRFRPVSRAIRAGGRGGSDRSGIYGRSYAVAPDPHPWAPSGSPSPSEGRGGARRDARYA